MFPQIPSQTLSLRENPPETQRTLSQVLSQDKPQDARVLRSTTEGSSGASRITLEVNGKTVQLITKQPLQSGSLLQISLTADGKVLLQQALQSAPRASTGTTPSPQLPPPPHAQTPHTPPSQASARVAPQVISLNASSELIPINKGTTTDGTVIKSTPTAASGSPAATQPQGTTAGAVYARPLPVMTPSRSASGEPFSQSAQTPPPVPTATSTASARDRAGPMPSTQPHQAAAPNQSPAAAAVAAAPTYDATTASPRSPVTPAAPGTPAQTATTPPVAQPLPTTQPTAATAPAPHTGSAATPPATGTPQPIPNTPAQNAPGTAATATAGTAATAPLATAVKSAHNVAGVQPAPTGAGSPIPPQGTLPVASATPAHAAATQAGSTPAGFDIEIRLSNGQATVLQSRTALSPNTLLVIHRDTAGQISAQVQTPPSAAGDIQREQSAIQEALRNALPHQQPVGDVLSQLQASAAQTQTAKPELSGLVRSMLQLFGVRPGAPEAPRTLQHNVQSGGMQTEANLASGKVPVKNDLKGFLNQLQQASADLPLEQRQRVAQLIQNMQSRITHNQVSSLQQWIEAPDGSFERVIQLDIPIVNNTRTDNLELRISQEHSAKDGQELTTLWRARLHFDLEEYGAVDAEIKLTAEEQIQVQFWCDEKATQRHIQKQLADFGQLLQKRGFCEPELNCYHGHSPSRQGELIQKHLVDIHT